MTSKGWMEIAHKPYPSDVCDEEWSLFAPYLTLLPEDAGLREHSLREVFNAPRYIVKTGHRHDGRFITASSLNMVK